MLYQLPNGKVIELSLEDYLEMSDEDFQNLVGYNIGEQFNNPFVDSILEDISEEEENDIVELPDVSDEEKLSDQDFELEGE